VWSLGAWACLVLTGRRSRLAGLVSVSYLAHAEGTFPKDPVDAIAEPLWISVVPCELMTDDLPR